MGVSDLELSPTRCRTRRCSFRKRDSRGRRPPRERSILMAELAGQGTGQLVQFGPKLVEYISRGKGAHLYAGPFSGVP